MSSRLLDVAVPLPIFKTFSYHLPREIGNSCLPGTRVLVPFGNKHLVGLVVGESAQVNPEIEPKPVVRVLDSKPLLSSALLKLGEWVSTYYFAPPGEAYRVMLPPGLLLRKASPGSDPVAYWPARKQQAVVALHTPQMKQRLTRRQRSVIEIVHRQELPVLVSQLVRETRCSTSVIKTLAAKGILTIKEIDIHRSPWSSPRVEPQSRHPLSPEQAMSLQQLLDRLQEKRFASCLLHGVTGSGKTEVYLNAIEDVVEKGRSAIMMVPEIGLTPQTSRQFRSWFGTRVAIMHSGLSTGERFDQWRRIREGEARIVVGTRSAIFAPLRDVGLIIVDEEHDASYKQDEFPRYHGRDTALKRAQLEQAVVVLGSATPQLETYHRFQTRDKSRYLQLSTRIMERPLPTVHIVDMRQEFERRGPGSVISRFMEQAIEERLSQGAQTLILLNRRGYASALLCRSCGHSESCVNCSISLTFHQQNQRLVCHYCGYARSVPRKCAECGKEYIYFIGEGTEKIQELLEERFSNARVDRLDRDAVQRKGSYERILGAFSSGRTDILVGTQMISKGHDFAGVTLVGVVGADQGLRIADFRAAERTFQLLTQVAGRAGRGDTEGEVILQTYYPNHYSLKYACAQDYDSFYQHELRFRRRFRYPPFTALANVLIKGTERHQVADLAGEVAQALLERRKEFSDPTRMRVLGPAPAALEKIKKDYRFQILIKTTNRKELSKVLQSALEGLRPELHGQLKQISIDIDPINLL